MFLTRAVEWRNRIVSIFREAGLAEGEEQRGLFAMSAFWHFSDLPRSPARVRKGVEADFGTPMMACTTRTYPMKHRITRHAAMPTGDSSGFGRRAPDWDGN